MHAGPDPGRRGAARVPRRAHRRAGLRRVDRSAARHRAAPMTATPQRSSLPAHGADRPRTPRLPAALLNGAGIETAAFTDARRSWCEGLNEGAAAVLIGEEHLAGRAQDAAGGVAVAAAAVVGPADPDPDASRRRLAGVGGSVAHARQRHAARAADARHHAAERGANRDSRARAPVSDPRPPRRAAREPSRRCAAPIAARTSSSPRSATSCAIRSRRS